MKLTNYDRMIIIKKHYNDLIATCGLKNGLRCSRELVKMFNKEKKRRKVIEEITKGIRKKVKK